MVTSPRSSILGDRYALEDVIGRGGMADVYRATDLALGRTVAVKVLRDPASEGSERARFAAEARTLAGLSHPNLTAVLDAGVADETPYLVMELVDGTSLAVCCDGVALDPGRVARLGTQLASALTYAHDSGIVHRDVKPSNVIVTPDDRAILTDFGIARLLGSTTHHTRTGTTIGSAPYLAPEQVRGDRMTPAVDIYSLGLVLLEALTGKRAYSGPPTEAALARLHRAPEIPPTVPDRWRTLIRTMTELEPDERPTARDVAKGLSDVSRPDGSADDRLTSGADATRPLTQPVPLPPAGEAETHVLRTPSAWAEFFDDVRSWCASAIGRVRAHPLMRTRRRHLYTGAILGAMACAALVMVVVAALSPDAQRQPAGGVPPGISADLHGPLEDLHDAINGSAQ